MKILRGEGGCPWDREQTHQSIRQNFIEETYEVIEAIDTEDTELLKEELGDVLLQVVFHSEIEQEQGRFDIDDVADGICKKLIVRHPHVFPMLLPTHLRRCSKTGTKLKCRQNPRKAGLRLCAAYPALCRG